MDLCALRQYKMYRNFQQSPISNRKLVFDDNATPKLIYKAGCP